jgi:MFS family permease
VVVLLEMLLVNIAERKLTITQTMIIGCILCGISYGMLAFTHHLGLLFLSIALLSCGEILVLPFMATITALSAQENNKGAYMGMNGIAVAIAFIISPLLGSRIATDYGFSTLWLGTAIILAIVALGYRFSIPLLLRRRNG